MSFEFFRFGARYILMAAPSFKGAWAARMWIIFIVAAMQQCVAAQSVGGEV
jgi:hypothetical protein